MNVRTDETQPPRSSGVRRRRRSRVLRVILRPALPISTAETDRDLRERDRLRVRGEQSVQLASTGISARFPSWIRARTFEQFARGLRSAQGEGVHMKLDLGVQGPALVFQCLGPDNIPVEVRAEGQLRPIGRRPDIAGPRPHRTWRIARSPMSIRRPLIRPTDSRSVRMRPPRRCEWKQTLERRFDDEDVHLREFCR
jgi:hypothetical protein